MSPTGAAIKPAIERETVAVIAVETAAGNTILSTVVVLHTPTNLRQTNMAAHRAAIPWAAVRQMLDKIRLAGEVRQDRRTEVVAGADRKLEAWIEVAAPAIGVAAVVIESVTEVQVRGPQEEAAERLEGLEDPEVRRGQVAHAALPVWDRAAVVDLAAVVAGAGGNYMIKEANDMRSTKANLLERQALQVAALIAISCFAAISAKAFSETGQTASATPKAMQKTFATPKEAADAFIKAAESFDVPALKEILGPDGDDLLSSEDAVQDKNRANTFVTKAREKNEITKDPKNASRAILTVGNDDWPLPIPLVQKGGKWSFDTKAGRQEILFRRIGSNELDAIQICRGYVEAQKEYATEKHDGAQVNQFAQRIISTPGKKDGLAWRNADGSLGGPIGEAVAGALEQGYSDKSQPYHGYFFKILKGQGPAAPLGQMDFVVNGAMIGGFALAAAPADYRVTGVKTFIVSYQGVVYEKDLGPDTLNAFKSMTLYNPDKTWRRTDDNW
jgi:Protein of unknown function (DUF2950)